LFIHVRNSLRRGQVLGAPDVVPIFFEFHKSLPTCVSCRTSKDGLSVSSRFLALFPVHILCCAATCTRQSWASVPAKTYSMASGKSLSPLHFVLRMSAGLSGRGLLAGEACSKKRREIPYVGNEKILRAGSKRGYSEI